MLPVITTMPLSRKSTACNEQGETGERGDAHTGPASLLPRPGFFLEPPGALELADLAEDTVNRITWSWGHPQQKATLWNLPKSHLFIPLSQIKSKSFSLLNIVLHIIELEWHFCIFYSKTLRYKITPKWSSRARDLQSKPFRGHEHLYSSSYPQLLPLCILSPSTSAGCKQFYVVHEWDDGPVQMSLWKSFLHKKPSGLYGKSLYYTEYRRDLWIRHLL